MVGGGEAQKAEVKQGNKRRPWLRLDVSCGGGILVIGGVIIAAALAAHRGHVNKQRTKRKTTPGTGYEQYHKEKEEEVKDGTINDGCGEITGAVGLMEIKKAGSMTEIKEQTSACSFEDGGSELCLCQSQAEETEEWKEEAETFVSHVEEVEVGLKEYEREEKQDDVQEVEEVNVDVEIKQQQEDDGCGEVGGDQMPVIHVEDDSLEDGGKGELYFNNVLPKDEGIDTKLVAGVEALDDEQSQALAAEFYVEETEPVVEEELEKGEELLQSNETNEEKGELFFNNAVTKDEEPDAAEFITNIEKEEGDKKDVEKQATKESYEEETEPLVKEEVHEELNAELVAKTDEEEAQQDEPATESCEEETESSDGSGASFTENADPVWPAEVLEHDETKEQMKINEAAAGQLATTTEKEKEKEFFIYVNHSRSMFLLVLTITLAAVLLSFHLSPLTAP